MWPGLSHSPRGSLPLDERRDPGDAASRSALMLRWLHRQGYLRYLYLRYDKPA